jgi:hypothetical protein
VGSPHYSNPTQPRASTREQAVVGLGAAPSPMNDLVRPCARNVETRGVDRLGKATGMFKLEVRVMVDGVRVVRVGEGGNTNSVWEGVETSVCEGGHCRLVGFFS